MNSTRSFFALALLTASAAFAAWTQDGDGSFTFDAKGPAGFKIHGESKKLTVTDDGTNMKVQLKLEDVDTDNSLRNRHMLEDMKAKENPLVTLSVPTASLSEKGGEATGTMELNGQKKETRFSYTTKCSGSSCEVEGTAPVNLNDFGIKIRSYMGVTVKPDIVVNTKFKVTKK
jgi:polyisoprenoid-binding protein YceI